MFHIKKLNHLLQGYHAVRALKPEMVIAYITKLFQHVTEWSSAATVNMTETQVLK